MTNLRFSFCSLLAGALLGGLAMLMPRHAMAAPAAADTPWVALSAESVDVAACKAFVDGKPVGGDFREGIEATLGWRGGNGWGVGDPRDDKRRDYLIVLRQPLAIGAVLFQGNGTLKLLKSGAVLPADPLTATDWQPVVFPERQSGGRVAALPAGTTTQAVLCSMGGGGWHEWHRFKGLRLFAPRLHNVVPDGLANGEAEYISYGDLRPPIPFTTDNITNGKGAWQSHGPDSRNNDRIPRRPVTDIDPSWFVVSWAEPQTLCGLLLESNFVKYRILAWTGPAGINPALGADADWVRIKPSATDDALLAFAPVKTRAIKFLVEKAKDAQFAKIEALQAYADLGVAPVPPRRNRQSGDAPQFKISYALPTDCTLAMAVDDAQGRRVRTLAAREERKAGDYAEGWDLKNDGGGFVAPGTYTWKATVNPGLTLKYEMTPYPNIEMTAPGNSPWLNGASGPGGWLADHTPPRAAAAAGDRIFFSAPCSESGVSIIECDRDGRKSWGHHNIIAWTGPSYMAADDKALYCAPGTSDTDYIWRFSLPDKKLDTFMQLESTATRKRGIRGLAVRDGKLLMSVSGGAVNWLENAVAAADVDQARCEPRYMKPKERGGKPDDPDFPRDFLRLFRLTGTPPGCKGLTYLETAREPAARQHLLLAFHKPVPVGSFVFPLPEDKGIFLRLSVLKPDAPYPPAVKNEELWTEVWRGTGSGWAVIPAPENTLTRAVRLSFDRGLDDVDEVMIQDDEDDSSTRKDDKKEDPRAWRARLEGMKILRRRFTNLFPTCKVTVNSGTANTDGVWVAHRERPLTAENPGVYMMAWDKPQRVRGLAIKEIDGRFTEIDAWTGAGEPDMAATAGWDKLATYEQKLRYYYQPDQDHNSNARYMDGYVDFGKDVATRAIRLRVVEQWLWKEEDRGGCVGVRKDRGGEELDPTRCAVYGVAPLQYDGGEPALDAAAGGRLEIYDLATKKLTKELPLDRCGDLAFGPAGELFAVSAGAIAKVDLAAGTATPLKLDVKHATALACDRAGNLYVYDATAEQRVVRVFGPDSKPLRTIGTPGGRIAGPWDPKRFASHPGVAVDLEIDGKDQLWVVECDYTPKRISCWGLDGTFKRDYLGNTAYGGGGCLDPYDKTRLFYGPMEFTLDWQSGKSQIKGITWMGDSPAGEQPIKVKDRTYLVTRPQFCGQAVGVVYLYENGAAKRVAAIGRAGNFPPLRASAILEKLGRKAIGYCAFAWSDRNGDGTVQAEEVTFTDLPERRSESVGRFEDDLGVDCGPARYEVKEVLANGVPVYERRTKAFQAKALRLDNGGFFVTGEREARSVSAAGKSLWTHNAEGWGVHALYSAKPYFPGQVVAQFDIVGHETAPVGQLGEFLVTNGNAGIWHIWTADGLLAGQLFRDMRGPRATPWSLREHQRGLDLTGVTCGQEHFAGYFCRTRSDNRFYAVAGHNHVSIVEVLGLDTITRLGGTLTVTQADVTAAIAWDRQQQARKVYERAKVITCRQAEQPVAVNGKPDEWEFDSARINDREVGFSMAYDKASLYLCYRVRGNGPLKNSGNDWKRLFKTGAAVDLMLGADPAAPRDRKSPVAGDLRLLLTLAAGKPAAVLYQPVAPGAAPGDAWETHTLVFKAAFDRVVQLTDVRMAAQQEEDSYCVEAAVPLKTLGLTITPDLMLKMDWGILVSGPDGNETFQRLYWANPQTSIVSDEAAEALLQPDLWGWVRFAGASEGAGNEPGGALEPMRPGGGKVKDELDLDE